MNSNDNNDDDGGQPPPNNNQSTNHSPYFSQIPGGATRANVSSPNGNTASSANRDGVNWEATAALLGGSGRSPGVAGMDRRSADNDDNAMDNTALPSTSQQYEQQQIMLPGMESTKPLPPLQSRQQQNQQQLHHHPDLPFLVTHWIAHYDALQSNNSTTVSSTNSEESKFDSFGSTFNKFSNNNHKTQEQKAKEEEARRRIQRAAADLAWSFQTLGAFGTSNTNTSSTVGRPATYSDMARKFAPLLATSTITTTTTSSSSSTSGQNDVSYEPNLSTNEYLSNLMHDDSQIFHPNEFSSMSMIDDVELSIAMSNFENSSSNYFFQHEIKDSSTCGGCGAG